VGATGCSADRNQPITASTNRHHQTAKAYGRFERHRVGRTRQRRCTAPTQHIREFLSKPEPPATGARGHSELGRRGPLERGVSESERPDHPPSFGSRNPSCIGKSRCSLLSRETTRSTRQAQVTACAGPSRIRQLTYEIGWMQPFRSPFACGYTRCEQTKGAAGAAAGVGWSGRHPRVVAQTREDAVGTLVIRGRFTHPPFTLLTD